MCKETINIMLVQCSLNKLVALNYKRRKNSIYERKREIKQLEIKRTFYIYQQSDKRIASFGAAICLKLNK